MKCFFLRMSLVPNPGMSNIDVFMVFDELTYQMRELVVRLGQRTL